jgi:squalene-associated FAD-dependent desaturase
VEGGANVTLCEARSVLGGRLGSFRDPQTGLSFDYGTHLLTAGYKETLELLRLIEAEKEVEIQLTLCIPFYHPDKGKIELKLPEAPIPLNFLAGMSQYKLLNFRDKANLPLRMRKLIYEPQAISAKSWLKGTSIREYEYFWKPLIIATMNCLPEEADMRMVRIALIKGFLEKGGLGFFLAPQSEIFHHKALSALQKKGIKVRLRCPVKEVHLNGKTLESVSLKSGEKLKAEVYIFAVTPDKLLSLFGSKILALGLPLDLNSMEYSDICNVHFAFEKRLFEEDFGALLDSLPQWFFLKKWNNVTVGAGLRPPRHNPLTGFHYSLNISSADKLLEKKDDLVAHCLADLKRCGANFNDNRLLFQKVVWSHKATVKLTPQIAYTRPSFRTELKNVFLAGDWIDTGLPATIESAVQSGFEAGDAIGI